ncbi:MAG: PrpR N-terminal domain-containing protein [Oscillibacter sp.]|nr:PrpR N-terminal domain-containing protein [Oscillibacter sp.]
MKNRIRVLGIAPYEGMKTLMQSLAEDYPQFDLTLFVGDMEQGVEIAKSNFHGNYDVVISRGGTAKMLRQQQALPVIDVEISMYDILCSLKLADGLSGKSALVSFADLTRNASQLCSLLDYHLDIITISDPDAVEPTLRRLQRKNYSTILCDMIANSTAKQLGLNSFLITSGIDSIRASFDRALLLCSSQERLRDENLFFRDVIRGQIGQTVVFDAEGGLFFSSLENLQPEVIEMLRNELPESKLESERRIYRALDGMLYSIRVRRIASGDLLFYAFFFAAHKSPLSSNQMGIQFSTRGEAENNFYQSIFSFAGTISDFQNEINRIGQSTAPVMVSGEDGTGKESIVSVLYLRSPLQNGPLVKINCSLLTNKSWSFLLEHHNSPLYDQGNTLYFSSIDVLSLERRQQLLSTLSETDVCQRNRVFFSCVCHPGEFVTEAGSEFMDKLCCLSLYLPPLCKKPERIPPLVNLSLSHLNADMTRKIVGTEPAAMDLLKSFQWPHNYTQFRRVIGELAVTAPGQTITAENVREILRKERHTGAFSPHAENTAEPLNLNRPLTEITRDIVLRVLKEMDGNQSHAANRLKISRTTLWRFIKK